MADILLIDDDDDLRTFVQKSLVERGHHVRALNRADGALEILAEDEFDLIVVDEYMPGLHGSDFLKALRNQGNDIPAILMTGLGTRSMIEPMKQLGAMVVPKPAAGPLELVKDLVPAVEETLNGEAELADLVGRVVKLGLKRGKKTSYLRWLLDYELRVHVSGSVNDDADEIKPTPAAREAENSIRLRGDIWHLRFEGESGDYPRNLSLAWLCKLLAAPNRPFTVAELRGDPDGKIAADASIGDDAQIDDAGLKTIKEELADINEVITQTGGSESLDSKKAELEKLLHDAIRGKKMDSPLKTTFRGTVFQIRTLYNNRLAKGSMPRLAAHLRAALKMDFPYIGYYPPPGTPAWQI
jgi:CheY-like chemotaxis protein